MTCFLCCADSDILLASKRCILWHGICCRDKMGVKTNWRYVGKAVGLRVNLCPHLYAWYCPRDCLAQTSSPSIRRLTNMSRHFTHGTNLTLYTEELMLITEVTFFVTNSASYSRRSHFQTSAQKPPTLAEIYHGLFIVLPVKRRIWILNEIMTHLFNIIFGSYIANNSM